MKKGMIFAWALMAAIGLVAATPTPVPTNCAADLNIPACNWTGLGQPGDLVMTLNGNGMIAGFNRTTNTWYRFSSSLTGIDGICTNYGDPTQVSVVRQDTGQIERFNSAGVSQGIWGTTSAGNKKIGAYNPLDGSFWVPDQSAMTLWRIPAAGGTGAQISVTGSGLNQPTGCAFDELGNLYITNAGNQSILKIAAAAATAAAGSGTAVASTLASGFSHSLLGIFYNGNGALYTAGWAASSPSNTSALYRVDTASGAKALLCSSFAPLSENSGGQLYQTDGVAVDPDGNIWMTQFQNPGSTVGLLKLSSTGTPLAFFPLPASIGGFSTGNAPPDDMAILGQVEPRPGCAVAAATPCPPTPTSTPTSTPTATQTPSPAPTLTATPTATLTVTATPSSTRTAIPASPTATPTATRTATSGATAVPPTATTVPTHVRRDDDRVACEPNFVRGRGQVMKIMVRAYAGGSCGIKVNRANGRVMADLWHGYLQPQETKVQDWNCTDSQGDESPSGVYYVVFTDGDGSIQVKKVLIVR